MLNSTSDSLRSVRALHRILIKARYLALQGVPIAQLVGILDWAERLASDIASPEEQRQFSEHLQGLGEDYPEFSGILRDYNEAS